MVGDKKLMKDFLKKATDDQVSKFVYFINMCGFYDGFHRLASLHLSDDRLVKEAISFVESGLPDAKTYLERKSQMKGPVYGMRP